MRYGGIERLVAEFVAELSKEHDIGVIGRSDSIYRRFPYGQPIKLYPYEVRVNEDIFQQAEVHAYMEYQSILREYDVIHDFSHQHLASRYNDHLPSLNIFWHAPSVAKYPKAPYNIIALSRWAKREYERVYQQKAYYQPTIVIPTDVYKLSNKNRNDRWLSLGAITPRKGHLEAIQVCLDAGVSLDIVGKEDSAYVDYAKSVKGLCDGTQIKYLGEVDDYEKVKLYQTNKGLIYISQEPEVTSHKIQEALLCGMPAVVTNFGANPEIVTQGINGYLCSNKAGFLYAVKHVDSLKPETTNEGLREVYSIQNVVDNYIPLYQRVANGERW